MGQKDPKTAYFRSFGAIFVDAPFFYYPPHFTIFPEMSPPHPPTISSVKVCFISIGILQYWKKLLFYILRVLQIVPPRFIFLKNAACAIYRHMVGCTFSVVSENHMVGCKVFNNLLCTWTKVKKNVVSERTLNVRPAIWMHKKSPFFLSKLLAHLSALLQLLKLQKDKW